MTDGLKGNASKLNGVLRTCKITVVHRNSELQDLKKSIDAKGTQVKSLSDEIKKGKKSQDDLRKAIADRTSGLEERRKLIESSTEKLAAQKKNRDELSNDRKDQWKTDSDLDTKVRDDLTDCLSDINVCVRSKDWRATFKSTKGCWLLQWIELCHQVFKPLSVSLPRITFGYAFDFW